jgi:hypothetical protein
LFFAALFLGIVAGCGPKDGPDTVAKQSDLPAPKVEDDQQQQPDSSGVGTGIRRIGQVKKN